MIDFRKEAEDIVRKDFIEIHSNSTNPYTNEHFVRILEAFAKSIWDLAIEECAEVLDKSNGRYIVQGSELRSKKLEGK